MESLVLLLLLSVVSFQHVSAQDDLLRAEIEEAAFDSKILADELAAMLARLEVDDSRQEAVEAEVIGDDIKVESALKEMLDKIESLELAAEDNADTPEFTGTLEERIEKETELIKTLETLETVAKEIDEVSSVKQLKTIDEMTELLTRINSKIENSVGDESKTKEGLKTSLHLNGIVGMIKSLEKVTTDLRDIQGNIDDYFDSDSENKEKGSKKDDDASTEVEDRENESSSSDEESDSTVNKSKSETKPSNKSRQNKEPKQKSRKGKQLDDDADYADYEDFNESTDDAEVIDDVFNNESGDDAPAAKEEDRSSGGDKKTGYAKEEENEDCEDTEAKNKVRVCVPKFSSQEQTVNLYSSRPEDVRHCYDM